MFYMQHEGCRKATKVVNFVAKWLNLYPYTVRQTYWEPLTGIYEFVINLWQTNDFKSSPKNLPIKPIKLWAVSENASSRNTIDGMELTANRPEELFSNTY